MMPGGERQRPLLRPPARRATSRSAAIGRDQVEDYAAPQGHGRRRGRALAAPEPRVRARAERRYDDRAVMWRRPCVGAACAAVAGRAPRSPAGEPRRSDHARPTWRSAKAIALARSRLPGGLDGRSRQQPERARARDVQELRPRPVGPHRDRRGTTRPTFTVHGRHRTSPRRSASSRRWPWRRPAGRARRPARSCSSASPSADHEERAARVDDRPALAGQLAVPEVAATARPRTGS